MGLWKEDGARPGQAVGGQKERASLWGRAGGGGGSFLRAPPLGDEEASGRKEGGVRRAQRRQRRGTASCRHRLALSTPRSSSFQRLLSERLACLNFYHFCTCLPQFPSHSLPSVSPARVAVAPLSAGTLGKRLVKACAAVPPCLQPRLPQAEAQAPPPASDRIPTTRGRLSARCPGWGARLGLGSSEPAPPKGGACGGQGGPDAHIWSSSPIRRWPAPRKGPRSPRPA